LTKEQAVVEKRKDDAIKTEARRRASEHGRDWKSISKEERKGFRKEARKASKTEARKASKKEARAGRKK
jgi:hypothetical protein